MTISAWFLCFKQLFTENIENQLQYTCTTADYKTSCWFFPLFSNDIYNNGFFPLFSDILNKKKHKWKLSQF